MFTTLMIVSLDQGKLDMGSRRIGQFDAWLLRDIGHDEDVEASTATGARAGMKALLQRWFALKWFPSRPERTQVHGA